MKKLGFLILLITIASIGYHSSIKQSLLTSVPSSPIPTQNIEQFILSKPDTTVLKAGGASYTDPQNIYTFLYPNDYAIDHQDDNEITRISKKGATQKGQTEMYDGVIMVFQLVDLGGKSLSEWIDLHNQEMTQDGTATITQQKRTVSLGSYPGYTYKVRSLGESTYLIVQHDPASNFALNITFLVADPERKDYQKDIDAILSTLELRK